MLIMRRCFHIDDSLATACICTAVPSWVSTAANRLSPRARPRRLQVLFEDYLKHGSTAAWLLVEFAISRLPVTSTWVFWCVVYAIVYSTFMWIYWAAAETWVYSVLDWRCPKNLGYYVAVAVLVMLTFWLMCASMLNALWTDQRALPSHMLPQFVVLLACWMNYVSWAHSALDRLAPQCAPFTANSSVCVCSFGVAKAREALLRRCCQRRRKSTQDYGAAPVAQTHDQKAGAY